MAQLTVSSGKRGRHSIKMDMTPMVDLAFLLLTFFVLTMTINKKFVVPIEMPDSNNINTQPVNIKRVLTLVLAAENKVYYYEGDQPNVKLTTYSDDGVRRVLLEANKRIDRMVVLIKPFKESKYKNMIDILDEIHITHVQYYYVVKETPEDRELISASTL